MESLTSQFLLEKRYNEGLNPATSAKYSYFFSAAESYGLDLDDSSSVTVRAFRTLLARLGSEKNWKPVTYNTARKIYRTYCGYLVREKILPENPFDQIPKMKEPQVPRKSLTSEQSKNLRYLLPKFFDLGTFVGFRNYAIFLTFLYT